MTDAMKRINELIAERNALFSQGATRLLSEEQRERMKAISLEIARLWDLHRREGHPPAVPPAPDDWERPRRGRKPRRPEIEPWETDTAA